MVWVLYGKSSSSRYGVVWEKLAEAETEEEIKKRSDIHAEARTHEGYRTDWVEPEVKPEEMKIIQSRESREAEDKKKRKGFPTKRLG